MSIRIKEAADLPSWFLKTDYSQTAEFSPAEWLIHLRRRAHISWALKRQTDEDVEDGEDYSEHIKEDLQLSLREIHSDPISRHPDQESIDEAIRPPYFGPYHGEKVQGSVRQPALSEIAELFQSLPRTFQDALQYLGDTTLGDSDDEQHFFKHETEFYTPYWVDPEEWWHMPACDFVDEDTFYIEETDRPFAEIVTINLEHSDESIIESFKAILSSLRKTHRVYDPGAVKRARLFFDRWSRYSILAYLDLVQWSVAKERPMPNSEIADALSRFRFVGEENIRKTTKPMSKNAISRSTLLRLESFVALTLQRDK